jgi:UDP-N-acetylmuramate-alanine ligase
MVCTAMHLHSFEEADRVFVLNSERLEWKPESVLAGLGAKLFVASDVSQLLESLLAEIRVGDHVVLMSNGDFQGLPRLLQQGLESRDHD